jgi:hypothetical protein
VFVNHQSTDNAAKLHERMPLATIARETGYFERQDCTNAPLAHRRDQAIEPRTGCSGPGASLILVDHDHLRPAELPRVILQRILSPLALLSVAYLVL